MMRWEKLLSNVRLGQEKNSNIIQSSRTGFQVDYDRVVFSPAFRRLQNKTQVFPLPKSDFVRNRLTHSLETASVGRSLGNLVGELVIKKRPKLKELYTFSDFGALVSAACLAHDIGNPPFGHAGEDAISSFFKSEKGFSYIRELPEVQKADLRNFEGNAAGFRVLVHTPPSHSLLPGGLGLCYSTLASFVKYPRASYPDLSSTKKQTLKKYNYFYSEADTFVKIAEKLHLNEEMINQTKVFSRFPLAFLVEASDDICYTVIDYEDGFQMGLISFDEIESSFIQIIGKENIDQVKYNKLLARDVKIAYLRSKAINSLIHQTANCFIEQEEEILAGQFDLSLIDIIPQKDVVKHIKDSSYEHIYTNEHILKIEAAGYKVLPGLLDFFLETVFSENDRFLRGARKLIPSVYLDLAKNPFKDPYTNLLNITMYVASLTDQHAIGLYRDINGISLSNF